MKYVFDDGWVLKTVKGQGKLKISAKKDKALNASGDDLISDLEKEEIYYAVNPDERSDDDEGSIMTDPIQYNIKRMKCRTLKLFQIREEIKEKM